MLLFRILVLFFVFVRLLFVIVTVFPSVKLLVVLVFDVFLFCCVCFACCVELFLLFRRFCFVFVFVRVLFAIVTVFFV